MKNYGKKISRMITICVVLIGTVCHAKVRSVKDRRDFEQTVSRGGIVVALFYQGSTGRDASRRENKDLMTMYEDVSNHKPYEDIDITFLKINRARPDLANLASLYGVSTDPVFIFFNNGKRLTDDKGKSIILNGSISRIDLQNFIEDYFGEKIKRVVADKEKRTEQMLARENESWKLYYYPRDMVIDGYMPPERQENME